jgi:phosphoglycerate dehydrogenase-like enzyme
VLDAAPRLRFVGELGGDRFAQRIDVDAAAARDVRAVDTSHAHSYPVAEWALALMMIGLRNAGRHFKAILRGNYHYLERDDPAYRNGELTGKRVGLVGCG